MLPLGLYVTLLLAISVPQTIAYTKFEPECSKPEHTVNYVAVPPIRGTLTILWSSVFTIFACTWTLLHLNVPEQRQGRYSGKWGTVQWHMKGVWAKTKWALATILGPEVTLSLAVARLSASNRQTPSLKVFADEDAVPWTTTHTIFANMGGFIIQDATATHPSAEDGVEGQKEDAEHQSMHEQQTPHPKQQPKECPPGNFNYGHAYHVKPDQLLKLRSKSLIKIPRITEEEIEDRSKSDAFTKLIAVCQISWTFLDVVSRAVRHLAITQLEISVIAFACCAILIYGINWSSPKDVSVGIVIQRYEDTIPAEVLEILQEPNVLMFGTDPETSTHGNAVPNNLEFDVEGHLDRYVLALAIAIFGAPHILAWNFTFPTPIERTIWRVSSVYCTAMGPLIGMLYATDRALSFRFIRIDAINFFLTLVYIAARLFILVEVFRTLCFLPPSAYISTWAANLPMVG